MARQGYVRPLDPAITLLTIPSQETTLCGADAYRVRLAHGPVWDGHVRARVPGNGLTASVMAIVHFYEAGGPSWDSQNSRWKVRVIGHILASLSQKVNPVSRDEGTCAYYGICWVPCPVHHVRSTLPAPCTRPAQALRAGAAQWRMCEKGKRAWNSKMVLRLNVSECVKVLNSVDQ